jgi:hypothetical protein
MNSITKKVFSVLTSTTVLISGFMFITSASPVLAATITIGNDTTARALIDSGANFTVVDTNHPASEAGTITQFSYQASNTNPFEFVVVDGSNMVKWVSPMITPSAVGVNTFTPTTAVPVQSGWNVGLYFSSTGTIPFDSSGASASWTIQGASSPVAGTALSVAGSGSRTYSFVATESTTSTTGTVLLGNNSNSRTFVDSNTNFTVVDTNNPAISSGQITSFGYYAFNTNPLAFVIVDTANKVQWISPVITPASVGALTYTPATPVVVQSGWNVGLYFSAMGSVPYDPSGATASWTTNNSGMPGTGSTLSYTSSGTRTYSVVAYGTTGTTTTPVLTTLNVTPASETLNVAATQQLTASPMDQNSTAFSGATIGYVSSNPSVATVSSLGLITAVASGTATITATATSGSTSVTGTSAVTVSTTPVTPPTLPTADFYIGNNATTRSQVDTASNFTVIDMNHPATGAGSISEFDYYASNTNPFEFVVVNGSNAVQWISPVITPSAIGFNTYTPTSPVPVQSGWNVGVHFDSTGTIPFDSSGASAMWTANGAGMPTNGTTLSLAGSGSRTYSFVAAVQNQNNGNGNGNGGDNDNRGVNLRIKIILNMIKRLLSQLGVTQTFTTSNGWTF